MLAGDHGWTGDPERRGEVEQTRDDTDEGWGEWARDDRERDDDRHLLEERPPHHDRA